MGRVAHGRKCIAMEMVPLRVLSRNKPDCTGDGTNGAIAYIGID